MNLDYSNNEMIEPFCNMLQLLQKISSGLLVVFKIGVSESDNLCVCLLKFIPDWILPKKHRKISEVLSCITSLMESDINIRISFVKKHIVSVLALVIGMLRQSRDDDHIMQIWNNIGRILCCIIYVVDELHFPTQPQEEFGMAQILGLHVLNKELSLYKKSVSYKINTGLLYLALFTHYYPTRITPFIAQLRVRFESSLGHLINLLTSSLLPILHRRHIIDSLYNIIENDKADHVKFMVNECGLFDVISEAASKKNDAFATDMIEKAALITIISTIILKYPESQKIIITHPKILPIILRAFSTDQFNQVYIGVVMACINCINNLLHRADKAIISNFFIDSGFIGSFCEFSEHYKIGIKSLTFEQQDEILKLLRNIVITVRKNSLQDYVSQELKRHKFSNIVEELIPVLLKSQNIIILRGYYHLNDLKLKTFF